MKGLNGKCAWVQREQIAKVNEIDIRCILGSVNQTNCHDGKYLNISQLQECIPVGCVPPTAVAVSGCVCPGVCVCVCVLEGALTLCTYSSKPGLLAGMTVLSTSLSPAAAPPKSPDGPGLSGLSDDSTLIVFVAGLADDA